MTIRVAIVEDDARYRASLETLLRHAGGFELEGSFPDGDTALQALDGARPGGEGPPWDLVLMDVELPGADGIACTRTIKARLPDIRVVVLTVFEQSATILEAICAGADGYLIKRTPPSRLVLELRDVVDGGSPLSAGVASTVLGLLRQEAAGRGPWHSGAARLGLTDREQEVLRCLVEGMQYKTVADHLDISLDTVRSHVRSVYGKLQVHSVAEAVSRAIRERLV
ncbi:MAG: response regulator transcription factor [Candidatus Palauibacterales bacterium]|nr:response regulator transcription factor [Candidatus Palauibacterales bacterium]MDP2528824.1 response regulator transcription factor [Candidatus Palauibacterales bacterium]